jgi:predicted anti-sigma-YlaC factor YlaD
MACFLSEGDGADLSAADAQTLAHLRTCEVCARRYEQVGWRIEALRAADQDSCDAVFTPERLDQQRNQILRRLEHLGHQARVLHFPEKAPGHLAAPHRRHMVSRWVAAAAVAGLVIGVSLGSFMNLRPTTFSAGRVASLSTPHRPAAVSQQAPRPERTALDEEAFLSRIDQAYNTQRAPELEPLDALTPHVREVALLIR